MKNIFYSILYVFPDDFISALSLHLSADLLWSVQYSPLSAHPSLFSVIALIRDFMELLATARKSFIKIQEIVKKVYGDKALKRMQI